MGPPRKYQGDSGLRPAAFACDHGEMLSVFEVHLVPGSDTSSLISDEIKKETKAQVMTVAEAKAVGFGGLPDLGPDVRLIAVAKRDGQWIQRALERSEIVSGFKIHEVD